MVACVHAFKCSACDVVNKTTPMHVHANNPRPVDYERKTMKVGEDVLERRFWSEKWVREGSEGEYEQK